MSQSISPQKLAANRANAALSTGPRTAAGKAASAKNARKHGFDFCAFPVSGLETLDETFNLRADLVPLYKPVNPQELFAVERIAIAQQSILRAARLESGLFTAFMNRAAAETPDPFHLTHRPFVEDNGELDITRAQKRNYYLAEGFHQFAIQSQTWTLFLRYQAQAERNYRRAVEEFERLKALRPEGEECEPMDLILDFALTEIPPAPEQSSSPNQPTVTPQPEQSQSATPAENEPTAPPDPDPSAVATAPDSSLPNEPTEASQPQESEAVSACANEPTALPAAGAPPFSSPCRVPPAAVLAVPDAETISSQLL